MNDVLADLGRAILALPEEKRFLYGKHSPLEGYLMEAIEKLGPSCEEEGWTVFAQNLVTLGE